ncbi:MAG TPA: hypothetical protein VNE82_14665, partial [Candidatus Binataceae bacterium]|nr:hypothetical protein [Candidatus Binataceae bacterium]
PTRARDDRTFTLPTANDAGEGMKKARGTGWWKNRQARNALSLTLMGVCADNRRIGARIRAQDAHARGEEAAR